LADLERSNPEALERNPEMRALLERNVREGEEAADELADHEEGLTLERIGDYAGHSASYVTERYRHLLEGHEREAAETLDAYLDRADTAARLAQIEG
jgi:hypothetical protein